MDSKLARCVSNLLICQIFSFAFFFFFLGGGGGGVGSRILRLKIL
jgi:hypothetical protein